jgi:hypothetical protein
VKLLRAVQAAAFAFGATSAAACSLIVSTDGLTGGALSSDGGGGGATDATDTTVGDAAAAPDGDGSIPDTGTVITPPGDGGSACPATPAAGLLVHYTFDEGSGTKLTDCSPNHLDATILGTADWTSTAPRVGSHALFFDGATTCAELPASPLLELATKPFTIAVWISIRTFSDGTSGKYIFSKTRSSATKGYRAATDDGESVNFYVGQASGTSTGLGKAALSPATWIHVALTADPAKTTTTLYVGGTLAATRSDMPAIIEDTSVPARIGCRDSTQNLLASSLDDFRLYDHVLSAEEIAALAK